MIILFNMVLLKLRVSFRPNMPLDARNFMVKHRIKKCSLAQNHLACTLFFSY